jgi:hypothetical protein
LSAIKFHIKMLTLLFLILQASALQSFLASPQFLEMETEIASPTKDLESLLLKAVFGDDADAVIAKFRTCKHETGSQEWDLTLSDLKKDMETI